jgi:hypothetical protein
MKVRLAVVVSGDSGSIMTIIITNAPRPSAARQANGVAKTTFATFNVAKDAFAPPYGWVSGTRLVTTPNEPTLTRAPV